MIIAMMVIIILLQVAQITLAATLGDWNRALASTTIIILATLIILLKI